MHDRYPAQARPSDPLYRHGDVLVRRVARLPIGVQPKSGGTLAQGERTGHSHRLAQLDRIQLWEQGDNLFLEVKAPSATLIHEEHRSIELPQGIYRVWKQREYRPNAYIEVMD